MAPAIDFSDYPLFRRIETPQLSELSFFVEDPGFGGTVKVWTYCQSIYRLYVRQQMPVLLIYYKLTSAHHGPRSSESSQVCLKRCRC